MRIILATIAGFLDMIGNTADALRQFFDALATASRRNATKIRMRMIRIRTIDDPHSDPQNFGEQ